MKGPMSLRETVVFLNTGSISVKCRHRFSGTRMSHSTSPNRLPAQAASNIWCCVSCHLTPHRRGNSMSKSSFTAGAFLSFSTCIPTSQQPLQIVAGMLYSCVFLPKVVSSTFCSQRLPVPRCRDIRERNTRGIDTLF